MRTRMHIRLPLFALAGLALIMAATVGASGGENRGDSNTKTPIQHLVVIFQENISFDHYFGTYPWAANPPGEPSFQPTPRTPTVNGLGNPFDPSSALLFSNPNQVNPQRLDRSQPLTCDQSHDYTAEQLAYDRGLMDMFVENTGASGTQPAGIPCDPKQVLDYYDGNTVTALWNYAQNFSLNDNSYSTGFGPSTPGALNLVTGNTFGANCGVTTEANPPFPLAAECSNRFTENQADTTPQGPSTVFSDAQPAYDVCTTRDHVGMGGRNIGNLLNDANISWGWFQGGFRAPDPNQNGTMFGDSSVNADNLSPSNPAVFCSQSHFATGSGTTPLAHAPFKVDYIPHHEPFQYFKSTANPMHLPPTAVAMIGKTDQANHQYDLTDFWAAADSGHLPAVSFLKAPGYEDGHPEYSTPLDEQRFLVDTINHLQKLHTWNSTAVVINYDDSDGWYDHQAGPEVIQSQTAFDKLTGTDCGIRAKNTPPANTGATGTQEPRCGYGMRQPLLLISPWARTNFVDNTVTDQASVPRFIEDNWLNGQRIGQGSADAIAGPITNMLNFSEPQAEKLFLNPQTGQKAGE